MNTYTSFSCLLLLITLSFLSCKDKTEAIYMANTPIYQDFESFRNTDFSLTPAREISQAGKLWVKDNYLFVVDLLSGVHFFDNTNPSNPINLGFLEIYACSDIAVSGNQLYADSYHDLLTFNISDIQNPQLHCRSLDVFDFKAMQGLSGYDTSLPATGVIPEKGVILGWKQEEITEEIEGYQGFSDVLIFDSAFSESGGSNPSLNTTSVGGSMARFTITENHLYVLDQWTLTTFNNSGNCLEETSTVSINRSGETLFPAEGNLFIGTTTGMLIYNLNNPGTPAFMSEFSHAVSCDPVVISGDKAYVTLRTGNRCQGDLNELVIINISDLYNPIEIATYDMTNPHGLGVDDSTLFLCDGSAGLKVFNVEDPLNLGNNLISHFQDIQAYDVIPLENRLIMSAKEGIYQYDYSDLNSIIQLSLIAVQ
ncbi:MAG: LVIVD repeat-containing protein [Flavobacteriales bacterium]